MTNQSEQINELATALAKAQGEILRAIKDSANPFFKSKYADLSSVWNACRQPLSKNGLSIIQTFETEGETYLITTLVHSSGQWIRSKLPILTVKKDAQEYGKAITYMRRYALSAIVGVSPDDDDDGNSANGNQMPASRDKQVEEKSRFEQPKFITTGEFKQIAMLVNGNEKKKNEILAHYGIDSLEMIPFGHGKAIINKLAANQEKVEV